MPAKTHQDILLMRWALFSVTGIVLIVVLYSVGVTPSWSFALRKAMAQAPFLLSPDAPALSPGGGFLLCLKRGYYRDIHGKQDNNRADDQDKPCNYFRNSG